MTWSGHKVRTARAALAARLPLPCSKCGRPVTADQRWQVDHIVPRWAGGTDSLSNLWPAHGMCNESDGGRRGAAVTNGRSAKRAPRAPSQRGIRGL